MADTRYVTARDDERAADGCDLTLRLPSLYSVRDSPSANVVSRIGAFLDKPQNITDVHSLTVVAIAGFLLNFNGGYINAGGVVAAARW